MSHRFAIALAFLAALLGAEVPVRAQCVGRWLSNGGVNGVKGAVQAVTMWDPDGPGPRSPLMVVAGGFSVAGNISANCIAAWNPSTGEWSPFGAGISDGSTVAVNALAVMGNGDLIAGG